MNNYKLIWMDFDALFMKLNDEVNKILETNVPENAQQQSNNLMNKSNMDINLFLNDQNNINLNNSDHLRGKEILSYFKYLFFSLNFFK